MAERQGLIAFVLVNYWPREGGAERQIREVIATLQHEGQAIRVIAAGGSSPTVNEVVFGTLVTRVGVGRHAAGARLAMGTLWQLHRMGPALVVASQLGPSTAASLLYAFAWRRPVIVRLSGGRYDRRRGVPVSEVADQGPFRRRFFRLLLVNSPAKVVSPSRFLLCDAIEAGLIDRAQCMLVPNGVLEGWGPRSQPDEESAHGAIAWYGRNDPVKNPEAFEALVAARPGLRFIAFGDVGLAEAPNLDQLGWVDRPEDVLDQAAVLVITSLFEGSPNIALQAISQRVRVVGFRIPALLELREIYPEYVELCATGDIEGLGQAIESALGLPVPPIATVPSIKEAAAMWLTLMDSMMFARRSPRGTELSRRGRSAPSRLGADR